jgi:hypothetical protein
VKSEAEETIRDGWSGRMRLSRLDEFAWFCSSDRDKQRRSENQNGREPIFL